MKKLLLTLIGFISLFCTITTSAQAQFVVEQSRIEKVVAPGKSYVNKMVLHNTTGETRKVRMYWQDFRYKEPFDGEKEFLPAGAHEYSLSNWATIDRDYATVPAKGSITVQYSIKVPVDADGGYYGVLFFEEDNPNNITSTGVKIVMRIGTIFFISTDANRDHASVDNLAFENETLKGQITNTGRMILFPEGTYYILDPEGLVADRGEFDKKYLPAGETASFEAEVKSNLQAGDYSAILTFDLGEGYGHVNEIDFIKNSDGTFTIKRIRD